MNGPESVWGSKWSILLKRPQWDETGFSLGPGGSLIIIIQGILSCHISQRLFPLHTNSATFPRWKLLLPSLFIFPTVAPRLLALLCQIWGLSTAPPLRQEEVPVQVVKAHLLGDCCFPMRPRLSPRTCAESDPGVTSLWKFGGGNTEWRVPANSSGASPIGQLPGGEPAPKVHPDFRSAMGLLLASPKVQGEGLL